MYLFFCVQGENVIVRRRYRGPTTGNTKGPGPRVQLNDDQNVQTVEYSREGPPTYQDKVFH